MPFQYLSNSFYAHVIPALKAGNIYSVKLKHLNARDTKKNET